MLHNARHGEAATEGRERLAGAALLALAASIHGARLRAGKESGEPLLGAEASASVRVAVSTAWEPFESRLIPVVTTEENYALGTDARVL